MNESPATASGIEVLDRLDILDLYARQSHAVDGGDGHGWASTYTIDGVFESPTYDLVARGYDALRDFATTSNSAALARGEQFRHVVSSIAMVAAGDGRVEAKAYLMIISTSQDGTRVDRSVVMHDVLRKVDGQWLMESRKTVRDF